MSDIQKTIEILRDFNSWRRGDQSMEQPDPWGIGQAIDDAIEAIEKSERYRLEVLQLEAQILALKNRLEEFADAIDFTLDNFSCKTFIPQKFI